MCASLTPVWNGGNRYTVNINGKYSTTQRCAIGHIALQNNTDVGSQYGAFLLTNRVVTGDKFQVTPGV
jgi:hypothetical protein